MWWLQDKSRLASELRILDALVEEGWVEDLRWSVDGLDLAGDLTLVAAGARYSLRMVYPQHYPNVPAWIMPADGETRLSEHQFGAGGSLCLEYGPDNWTPGVTGEDVLRSAFKLLSTENPQGSGDRQAVEAGHAMAPFQLGVEKYSAFIGETLMERLKAGPVLGLRATKWVGPGAYPLFLFDPGSNDLQPPPAGQYSDFYDLPVFQSETPAPEQADNRTTLTGVFSSDAITRDAIASEDRALLIFGVGKTPIAYQVFPDNSCLRRLWTPVSAQGGLRTGAPRARATYHVAIVGAGSVGSKVAESLVRSGLRHFFLVDGDFFLPENLERNALDWRDVGSRKVAAVQARLQRIAPDAQIEIEERRLDWQGSSRVIASIAASIGNCDLVVDATGDTGAALLLGSIAAAASKPFVSAEVFEGGIGALISACLPGRTPPYSVARARFLDWCAEQGDGFQSSGRGGYGGVDDDGSPIVADDATVTIAAGHTARLIVDIVDGMAPQRPRAWQLIGLRDQWVFAKLGPLIHFDVGEPLSPPQPADHATEAFVDQRLKEVLNALAAAG